MSQDLGQTELGPGRDGRVSDGSFGEPQNCTEREKGLPLLQEASASDRGALLSELVMTLRAFW